MNPTEESNREERLVRLLAAAPEVADPVQIPEDLRAEWEQAQECLRLLDYLGKTACIGMAEVHPMPGQVGRFRVLRTLGQGGFGIVYQAHDPTLNREVALKVLRPRRGESADGRQRFLREARAAAGLEHPNLVPVYETGEADGHAYIAFAYCDGPNLKEWQRTHSAELTPRLAARIVADLAGAVQHAHEHGILHRDIKPLNVLMASPTDGHDPRPFIPRLTDFGLARLYDPDATPDAVRTANGVQIGTPAYFSPEQAAGKLDEMGPWTDVFGLGAVLYELLTGHVPYPGETAAEAARRALRGEIVPPRTHNPRVPRSLERICLRALAADPHGRFASAGALGDVLEAHLCRPRRIAWISGLVCVLGLLLGTGLALHLAGSRPADTPSPSTVAGPLTGELIVRVWTDDPDGKRGLRVEEPGALPLLNGEMIHLHVRLDQPAHVYLIWIGGSGKVQPLYPWNPDTWDLPSEQTATREVHSPPELNRGYRMKGGSGLETALMLARATPLPADTDLAKLVALPAGKLRNPREVAWLEHGGNLTAARFVRAVHRDLDVEQSARIEEPVLELMERLRAHFELMKVVRFAHQGE